MAVRLIIKAKVRSITYDNGLENRRHQDAHCYGVKTFFADPYSSWQKGSVENANKMLRRYFPKGTDFSKVKQTDVDYALHCINNKPRKILDYKSSLQVAKEKGLLKDEGVLIGGSELSHVVKANIYQYRNKMSSDFVKKCAVKIIPPLLKTKILCDLK